jgi:hypothetical protein
MYKERLNPKSKVFFQCPKVRPKNDVEPLEVGRRLLLIVLDISLSALSDVQLV